MPPAPLVTVIIPSYNHAQYVRNAIKSVLAQTYERLELVVIDDGSRDNSAEVISEFSDHPKVTTILNSVNCGQSAVVNQALAASTGKYVSILPSDDWYLPEKTALQVAKMESSGPDVGVVFASGDRYFEDTGDTRRISLPVRTGWIAKDLIELGNFIYPITPLYRRDVLEKIQPDEQFKAEGEAIHLRIALQYRYEYVDEVVAVMRDHTYNIGKNADIMVDELVKHGEWFFSLPDLPDDIRALKNLSLHRVHRIKGMQFVLSSGDLKRGRHHLMTAIRLRPVSLLEYPLTAVALALTMFPHGIATKIIQMYGGRKKGGQVDQ